MRFSLPWHRSLIMSAVVLVAACGGRSGPTAAEAVIIRRVNDRDNTASIQPGPISADFVVCPASRKPCHLTTACRLTGAPAFAG